MSADVLLSRLHGVKKTGRDRWMALCPAHGDKRPSLSVRETDDGTTLINCLGGCGALDVLEAVDLAWSDLFPAKHLHHRARERRRFFRADVFETIRFEATVVWLIGTDMANGRKITRTDWARLGDAVGALERAKDAAYGE